MTVLHNWFKHFWPQFERCFKPEFRKIVKNNLFFTIFPEIRACGYFRRVFTKFLKTKTREKFVENREQLRQKKNQSAHFS
jgi:hypothetical protein